jgi:glycosyltransferase involved in cell wall biosynthesis
MEQLPDLTRQAWLGLNLLDAVSPSYYYSLANKCFDYIQAGVPSVQMDFPEYRALQDRYTCFLLLPSLDAGKLANLIQAAAENADTFSTLRVNNKRAAIDLNWEREREVLLGIWG